MSLPASRIWPISSCVRVPEGNSAKEGLPKEFASERRFAGLLRGFLDTWRRVSGAGGLRLLQARSRRLQVHETVQLGEKRFVAILRVDGEQFLIGGSAGHVSLLAELKPESPATFGSVLESRTVQERSA